MAILLIVATPVWAVQPDEILQDPALETRAREISEDLRCLVCRNENIDESNADLARDLRLAVRERLVAGDTNDEAVDFLVDRYGEYILLNPQMNGANLILWLAAPAMFLTGLAVAGLAVRRRRHVDTPEALSDEEQSRVDALLKD